MSTHRKWNTSVSKWNKYAIVYFENYRILSFKPKCNPSIYSFDISLSYLTMKISKLYLEDIDGLPGIVCLIKGTLQFSEELPEADLFRILRISTLSSPVLLSLTVITKVGPSSRHGYCHRLVVEVKSSVDSRLLIGTSVTFESPQSRLLPTIKNIKDPWQPCKHSQVAGSVFFFRHHPSSSRTKRNNHYNYDTYLLFIYFSFRPCLDRILRSEDKLYLFFSPLSILLDEKCTIKWYICT